MYYLKNTNFWMFGFFFFFYFFIMGAYFPFFPIWLHEVNHISKGDTGIIFACISLFSLLFQPIFGLLSDKLGLRLPRSLFTFLVRYYKLIFYWVQLSVGFTLALFTMPALRRLKPILKKPAAEATLNLVARACLGAWAGRCAPRLPALCSPSITNLSFG